MPEGRRRRILPFGCCFVGKEWVTTCMKRLLPQKSVHEFPFFCSNTFDMPKRIVKTITSHFGKKNIAFFHIWNVGLFAQKKAVEHTNIFLRVNVIS